MLTSKRTWSGFEKSKQNLQYEKAQFHTFDLGKRESINSIINSFETPDLLVANAGIAINGAIGEIFTDWIKKKMPDRADKVLHQIKNCHGGTLNESRYGVRMKGEGKMAKQISDLMDLARLKYFKGKSMPHLNTSLHELYKDGQMKLF